MASDWKRHSDEREVRSVRLIPRWLWKRIPHEHQFTEPYGFIIPGGPQINLWACSRCGHEKTTWDEVKAKFETWFAQERAREQAAIQRFVKSVNPDWEYREN